MKNLFAMALLLSAGTLSAAETPVSAESFVSNGALSFKLENYSRDTGYDCVISYDLRTYDDDHAYVRTAANLQTKTIFVDKKSTKRIKADFELQENEKMADFAHAVKAPNCVPATKSRAVLLKDYYAFDNYVEEPRVTSKGEYLGLGKEKGLILKADFKDITLFEISVSKEIDMGDRSYAFGGYDPNPNPETMKMYSDPFRIFFINDVRRNIEVVYTKAEYSKGSVNTTGVVEYYYFNNKTNKIEQFVAPEGKMCGLVLATDYFACVEQPGDGIPVFINPRNKESVELDSTSLVSFKDSSVDQAQCGANLQLSLVAEGDKFRFTNRCISKNNELLKFDVFVDKENEDGRNLFKFSSYNTVNEENLKLVDIRREFPWASFIPNNVKDPSKSRYVVKEKLDDIVKRLFKKTPFSQINIINTGKEEYFDVQFTDSQANGYFGRIYWNEIK